ncbi:MAG: hypothetical protein EXR85_02480 [Xanthomonadales bacterium]|nr:hypothetical protein [Xanthomonadales bacterium]
MDLTPLSWLRANFRMICKLLNVREDSSYQLLCGNLTYHQSAPSADADRSFVVQGVASLVKETHRSTNRLH